MEDLQAQNRNIYKSFGEYSDGVQRALSAAGKHEVTY